MVADDEHWNDNYRILKQRIIASYLTWPIYYLNEVFGEDNATLGSCTLPNKASGKGNIPWDINTGLGAKGFRKAGLRTNEIATP